MAIAPVNLDQNTPQLARPDTATNLPTGAETPDQIRVERAAEAAIRDGDTARAIVLLEHLLTTTADPDAPRARELLGILRERAGRREDARTIYRDYLIRYPGNEGAPRVRQRLAELGAERVPPAGATTVPPPAPPTAPPSSADPVDHLLTVHGALGLAYLRDRSTSVFRRADPMTAATRPDSRDNVDELLTTADAVVSAKLSDARFEARVALGRVTEFRPVTLVGADRGRGSYTLFDQAYFDVASADRHAWLRVGRQKRYGAGVFGRVDGIAAGFDINPHIRIDAVAGYAVWSAQQVSIDRTRPLFGARATLKSADDRQSVALYSYAQRAGGQIDRRGVGVELRLLYDNAAFAGVVDYDLERRIVGTALANATVRLGHRSTLVLSVQQVHLPTYVTGLAMGPLGEDGGPTAPHAGVPVAGLTRDPQIRLRTGSIAYTRELNAHWQAILDLSIADATGLAAARGLPALAAAGFAWTATAQVVGNDIVTPRDVWLIGVQASRSRFARALSLDISTRLPVTSSWSLTPRVQATVRLPGNSGTRLSLAPSIKLGWQATASLTIEARAGINDIWQRYRSAPNGLRFEHGLIGEVSARFRF